jgi:hypothetical protein
MRSFPSRPSQDVARRSPEHVENYEPNGIAGLSLLSGRVASCYSTPTTGSYQRLSGPIRAGVQARHHRGVRWLLRRRTAKCRDLPASRPEQPGRRADQPAPPNARCRPEYRRPVSICLALPPRHGKSLSRCAKPAGPRPARPARRHPGRRPVGPTRSLLGRARVGRSHVGRRWRPRPQFAQIRAGDDQACSQAKRTSRRHGYVRRPDNGRPT